MSCPAFFLPCKHQEAGVRCRRFALRLLGSSSRSRKRIGTTPAQDGGPWEAGGSNSNLFNSSPRRRTWYHGWPGATCRAQLSLPTKFILAPWPAPYVLDTLQKASRKLALTVASSGASMTSERQECEGERE